MNVGFNPNVGHVQSNTGPSDSEQTQRANKNTDNLSPDAKATMEKTKNTQKDLVAGRTPEGSSSGLGKLGHNLKSLGKEASSLPGKMFDSAMSKLTSAMSKFGMVPNTARGNAADVMKHLAGVNPNTLVMPPSTGTGKSNLGVVIDRFSPTPKDSKADPQEFIDNFAPKPKEQPKSPKSNSIMDMQQEGKKYNPDEDV